jgi:hypothetical protein
MTPELFASDILIPQFGTGVHSSPSFSSDGKEIYWTIMPENAPFTIRYMKQVNYIWTEPIDAPFIKERESFNSLFLNDDTILFKSAKLDRPDVNTLWKVQRKNELWGKPEEFNSIFDGLAMGTSITNNGSIYFTLAKKGFGSHKIYKSALIDDRYMKPELLPLEINAEGDNWQPFVAPDESYLIFGRYFPEEHTSRLFISFKTANSSWSEAKSLDSINKINKWENAGWPYVSPDGKFFFFVSSKDNKKIKYQIYWVDIKYIWNLKDD